MREGEGDEVGMWGGTVNSVAHRAPFADLARLVAEMAQADDAAPQVTVVKRMLEWSGKRQRTV